jgi:ribosomal protein S18 acetylase RimI-like enzyme
MSSFQFLIRSVTAGDAEHVVDFYHALSDETWRFYNPHPRDRDYLENLVSSLPNRPDQALFMASTQQDGHEIMIGTVFFWDWTRRVPWFGICTRDGWQGQGVGDRMTAHAVEYAHQHGKGGILLTTHKENFRAQALYNKYGFETIGTDSRDEWLMILRY